MSFSISSRLLLGSLEDKFESAASAGFTKIDINALDVTTSFLEPSEIAKLADEFGLEIYKFQPFYGLEGQIGSDKSKQFSRFEYFLETAKTLGAKIAILGSSSEPIDEDQPAWVADFRVAADLAENMGLRVGLLPLPWATHIRSHFDAYTMVEAVDHEAFGLAMNSYFALADGSKPAAFRAINGKKIFSVQLADAPVSQFDISQFKHEFACLPGLGNLSLSHFVRVLAQNGYHEAWSLAHMGEWQSDGENRAKDGLRALSNLLDRASENLGSVELGVKALPPRDALTGFEFLEFAIDNETGEAIRTLLSSLCFRMERKHKSKPVELWRQGAINIVLNTAKDGFAKSVFNASGPSLCDMGLRVKDAQATVSRAKSLGVLAHKQSLGEGELNIPAVKGVGNSVLHFMDERSNLHHVWDIEFDAVVSNDIPQPAGLRRIDHVAQTVKKSDLDHWLLFYLSVFNVQKSPLVDVLDPSGVVYSHAVESPEGEVRLNLNGASSHHTFSGAFLSKSLEAGVQHIAMVTDDIFETSQRLFETDFARLDIPKNYYSELALNYGLDREFVETLRAANILYTHNESGEYFQLYSQPIWNGFFVEIVQRKNGYSGYGARNAPVRLAAQNQFLNASHS